MQLITKQQTGKKRWSETFKICAVFVHCTHNFQIDTC